MSDMKRSRIELIDTWRGLAVFLMVIHHFFYDLCAFAGAPWWLFTNPVFDFLHYVFAGSFIFLAGVSSRFSRSNLKRGAICFGIAMVMTVVTTVMDMPIRFGVLHLLGVCMLFYGACGKALDSLIPHPFQPVIYAILGIISVFLLRIDVGEAAHFLFPFGWTYPGFSSSDWFPLFPWAFVFLAGAGVGYYIAERRFPGWFYEWRGVPALSWLGKRALIVYVIHQPVLYGVTMGLIAIRGLL
ncbi:MAG: DUF1624 domain-containing protein [Oscillospiraceae bacterium]|nr:DUF1624 domain-containing protein [Oscillospiraceae bacterium]